MNTTTTNILNTTITLKDIALIIGELYRNELSKFDRKSNLEFDIKDLQHADKVLYEDNIALIVKNYFGKSIDKLDARMVAYNVRRFFNDFDATSFIHMNELQSKII